MVTYVKIDKRFSGWMGLDKAEHVVEIHEYKSDDDLDYIITKLKFDAFKYKIKVTKYERFYSVRVITQEREVLKQEFITGMVCNSKSERIENGYII